MPDSRVSLGTVVLSLVAAVVVAALVYVFWPNEERIIRARLIDIASILTVPANEAVYAILKPHRFGSVH